MFSYNVIGSESIRRSRKGMCSKKAAPSPLAGYRQGRGDFSDIHKEKDQHHARSQGQAISWNNGVC